MNEGKFYPDSEYLSALQRKAEVNGRKCVVGGLIKNEDGAIFVQKRSMARNLFPGCWDIVGGHVESGETLYSALAREIKEETGWQLAEILSLVKEFDWEEEQDSRSIQNREFDFLVRVDGNRETPQIEMGKFSEFRWVDQRSLDLLLENRPAKDAVIQEIVRLGLETAVPPKTQP